MDNENLEVLDSVAEPTVRHVVPDFSWTATTLPGAAGATVPEKVTGASGATAPTERDRVTLKVVVAADAGTAPAPRNAMQNPSRLTRTRRGRKCIVIPGL